MVRYLQFGLLLGANLRFHWTIPSLIVLITVYCTIFRSLSECVFHLALFGATGCCVFLQEIFHLIVARRLRIATRDLTFYPFWAVPRFTRLGERPWQETYAALVGPPAHALIAAVIAAVVHLNHGDLTVDSSRTPTWQELPVYLFWANVLLTIVNILPFFPLDGGRVFRASLAMTTNRLRATEVAALMSDLGSIALLIFAAFVIQSPVIASAAVMIYLAAQEELGLTRQFASFQWNPLTRKEAGPTVDVPLVDIVDDACRPDDSEFTGFTWNAAKRLWIEWRNGRPIAANAVIGD